MNIHKRLIHLLFGITLAFFLYGCQKGSGITSSETLNPSATITKESGVTIITSMPTISQMPNSTSTPILTAAETPNIPKLSPLPTLVPSEATARINELLKTNAGCKFPCWWGITPGETTWDDTYRLLMPLTYYEELLKANVYISNIESADSFSAGFGFNAGNEKIDQGYVIQNNVVEYIEIRGYFERYTVPELISSYGKPEEVLIGTYSYGANNQPPFDMLLVYPSKGILAYFSGPDGQIIGDNVNICFKEQIVYALDLWNPKNNYSLEQISKKGEIFNLRLGLDTFQKLQDTTSVSLDAFVTVISKDKAICINTPIEYWKSPFE
jgi:hypothetical protein